MLIYHGSNQIVEKPLILENGHTKDFGFGFYCTKLQEQAIEWAFSKCRFNKNLSAILNIYEYSPNNDLNIKIFNEISKKWFEFIINCRMNNKKHNYDIVEGGMADDKIWWFFEDYVNKEIPEEELFKLAKFKKLTHQIVFCSEKSLQFLKFKQAIILNKK